MQILPTVLYFSAFTSILYYLGAMQWLMVKLSWIMQFSLGTSATESLVAAGKFALLMMQFDKSFEKSNLVLGNIFVGQTESPLLIRPFVKDLTTSELHAVMTAGFGTVAGSVLGAFLGYGVFDNDCVHSLAIFKLCLIKIVAILCQNFRKGRLIFSQKL